VLRDFRGVSTKAFDGRGNYTLDCTTIDLPEISIREGRQAEGMNVTIVTTARDDNQARTLLKASGIRQDAGLAEDT